MADIHVSNARRVGFTAMAVFTFWLMAGQAYSFGWEAEAFRIETLISLNFVSPSLPMPRLLTLTDHLSHHWFCSGPCLAIVPTSLIAISIGRAPCAQLMRWVLGHATLFTGSIALVFVAGSDSLRVLTEPSKLPVEVPSEEGSVSSIWFATIAEHTPWAVLPLILTTAFVIYGAWRRAARDRRQGDVEDVVACWRSFCARELDLGEPEPQ